MKKKRIKGIGSTLDALKEKSIELYYWLSGRLGRERSLESSLVEEYFIKEEFMNDSTVKEFLNEREKIIAVNRHRMRTRSGYTSKAENEIGEVTLYCRGKEIDKATLVTERGKQESRIIYWKFAKTDQSEKS